jgi:hypothetical protein
MEEQVIRQLICLHRRDPFIHYIFDNSAETLTWKRKDKARGGRWIKRTAKTIGPLVSEFRTAHIMPLTKDSQHAFIFIVVQLGYVCNFHFFSNSFNHGHTFHTLNTSRKYVLQILLWEIWDIFSLIEGLGFLKPLPTSKLQFVGRTEFILTPIDTFPTYFSL